MINEELEKNYNQKIKVHAFAHRVQIGHKVV